jgi:hypothetical protein
MCWTGMYGSGDGEVEQENEKQTQSWKSEFSAVMPLHRFLVLLFIAKANVMQVTKFMGSWPEPMFLFLLWDCFPFNNAVE